MCGHGGRKGGGMNLEVRIDIYTLPCVKQIASGNSTSMLCGDLNGKEI